MFLRFNEVRSSGEKQHDVVVVFVPPALVVAVGFCGLREEAEGAGGQGEQRGGRNFLESRELSHLPSLFTFVYTPSSSYSSLMKPHADS